MNDDIQLSKNIKLNSDSLMKNLEISEEKLKNGATIEEAFNKAAMMWYNFTEAERERWKVELKPQPTEAYTNELIRIINKYDSK